MASHKAKPWHIYATWIARGLMVLFGTGFIGLAITTGIYKQKVDRIVEDISTFKIIHEMDKRIAILEERTKSVNASIPPPVLRPTAGKQR